MEDSSESETPPEFSSQEINTVELPPCIEIKESLVHKGEAGAFAKMFIRKDTRFGPYKGEIINPGQKEYIDYRYAWEVHEKRSRVLKFTISALDPKVSNWMRHVNNARFYEEQNILSVQDGFSIFYVAMKNIFEGQELLTWFDPKLLKRTQRRQTRTERRPIGYTIELVPWSDEKKFTPEIIDRKRARKKKVLSDMISLDENPMAMTRTLQSLPKIPCTPRQLGNMAYPLANSLKRRKKEHSTKQAVIKRGMGDKRKAERKTLPSKPVHIPVSSEKVGQSPSPHSHIETKTDAVETKIKLESLPPHENLKEALQAAQDGPKLVPHIPHPVPQVVKVAAVPAFSGLAEGKTKIKRRRGRKKLSDIPGQIMRLQNGAAMDIEYSPGMVRPVSMKNNGDGATIVEDHDESYIIKGVVLHPQCDDTCPCLNRDKCMRVADPPSAANSYAIRFTLLPDHKIVKEGKTVYKCDVCDGTYNHAFSLKRHYLSVHVNHRYLTREDIVNCQIETFHTGIQTEEYNYQTAAPLAPQSSVPVPAFMAVNVTNLLASLSPPKRIHDDCEKKRLQELGNRLHCEEELTEDIKNSHVSKSTKKIKSVPSLSFLAQACVNRLKAPPNGSYTKNDSKMEKQISLECKETIKSDLLTPTKADIQRGNAQIIEDVKSSFSKDSKIDFASEIATQTHEILKYDGQAEIRSKSSSVDEKLVKVGSTESINCKISSCESSTGAKTSATGISSGLSPDDSLSNVNLAGGEKSCSSNLTANCCEVELKNRKQEKENESIKTERLDSYLSEENKIKEQESTGSSQDLPSEAPQPNQDEDKDETDSCLVFASDSKVLSSEASESADIPTPSSSDLTSDSLPNAADKLQESKSVKEFLDCSISDKDCPKTQLATKPRSTNADKGNAHTLESLSSNSKLSSSSSSSNGSNAPLKESSQSPTQQQWTSPTAQGQTTRSAQPPLKESSQSPTQQQWTSLTAQGQTTRSAQPPLIFLTNIVFPVGAAATLGQPVFPQQRPPAAALPQTVTTLSSTSTPLTPHCPTSLVQTAGLNAKLPGPRAPVPLVLISQVPPGVDPRNAANSFLKTSTGIKTLQDLQKSLTEAGIGNTNTQLPASNLPCLIAPLNQGVGAVAGKTVASFSRTSDPLASKTSTGCIPLSPKVSLPVSAQSSQTGNIISTGSSTLNTAIVSSTKVVASNISTLKNFSTFPLTNTDVTSTCSATVATPSSAILPPKSVSASSVDQPEDLFRCHMCVLVFQSMEQLKHHIRHDPHRFKGGIKQYACLQCSMRFSNKNNLDRHNQMNHTGREDYKFRCFTCGKGFSSETYLKMHARFHSGKSFPCKYGCKDVYFPNAATLVKHLRTEHAGLDLKEYKRIHKIKSSRRKKINQILGPIPPGSSSTASQISYPAMSQQEGKTVPYNILPVVGFDSTSNCPVIGLSKDSLPVESPQAAAYSLLQPGVGFQAKRGRPKGSKNTVKKGQPIIPCPVNSASVHLPPPPPPPPTQPLKVDVSAAPAVQEPSRVRRRRGIARYFCKLCPRKFTTHLKLLRHRTRKHGMDQSVQEYLHFMSRNLDGYASEPDENVYSPPASPKTFFSNVCQRGYENFTQFIDGGLESLKSPIQKYINIKGFSSISSPFDYSQEQKLEIEWTSFNFPPSFKYNYDSTTFYDSESGENLKALTDKTLAQVKNENNRDSTPEMEYAQTDDIKPSEKDLLTFPIKQEEPDTQECDGLQEISATRTAENERANENKDLNSGNRLCPDGTDMGNVKSETANGCGNEIATCKETTETTTSKSDNETTTSNANNETTTSNVNNETIRSNIDSETTPSNANDGFAMSNISNETTISNLNDETAASNIDRKTTRSNVNDETAMSNVCNETTRVNENDDIATNNINVGTSGSISNAETAISNANNETGSDCSRKAIRDQPCVIGSKERGEQIIESLARHLAFEKLPDGESDVSESPSQEEEGVEYEVEELVADLHIKIESLDEEPAAAKETIAVPVMEKDNFATVTSNSQSAITVEPTRKDKLQNLETQNLVEDDIPPSGADSGLSSLSPCTSESVDLTQTYKNVSNHDEVVSATCSTVETKPGYGCKTQLRDVEVEMREENMSVKKQAKKCKDLPFINALDRKELMKSLTIQGIIAEDSIKVIGRKLSVSSPAMSSSSNLNALDLHVPGGQLTSDRLAQKMNSISHRQEAGARPDNKDVRRRSISLPSFKEGETTLNTSDAGKHHEHRRLSLWGGHLPQKTSDLDGHEAYHYCPIINILQKQQALRELESYEKAKADRDKGVDKNHFPGNKLAFAESMGLMSRADFDMSPHAKQKEVHVIKPPEVWTNYENIWFGKRGTIVVVCSICHRHFSCWDLCLRHQLKKHPHIEPNFLLMEKGNYVDDMYYYYPMKFGILAQTEPIPSNLPLPELFVCTRCGFPFRNLNRLHAHIVSCDPSLEGGARGRSSQSRKKLIPMMDRRLSQQIPAAALVKPKLGRPFKRPPPLSNTYSSNAGATEKPPISQLTLSDTTKVSDKTQSSGSEFEKAVSLSPSFSFYHGRKRKNYELLYNPQNHMRRRESYQVLDTHQCHGCNLKFKSMSMLERHVKKCSGRDRLQSQKPLLSGIMPDDATVRKQHTCRYCNKRFTYIKGVDLHYKRICSVRKVRAEEGQLTLEDLAHEEELRKIIEHFKWSKTLNKDSSDIIQGNVRVEEDGSLTRVVKQRGCPAGSNKKVKKRKVKNKRWTYMKNHRHANRSAASSAGNSQPISLRPLTQQSTSDKEQDEIGNSSVQGKLNFPKKRSSPNGNLSSPPKKSLMLDLSPCDAGSKETDLNANGKRGRPRKYPIGDPRSRTPRLTRSNSSTTKTTTDSNSAAPASVVESPATEADKESSDKPQPRKRGRPKKFDPSDMESSYKKKKKTDLLLENSSSSRKDHRSSGESSEAALKQNVGQVASPAVTRRQQRAKMPTAAVREDFVYDDVIIKRKQVFSKGKSKADSAQTLQEEKPLFSELELMEKMKELKKAAQIESDRYKQRQEQRKTKGKNLNKSGEGEKPSSKTGKKSDMAPTTNSIELFKHLTEDIPLVSKAQAATARKGCSKQVTTLSVKGAENILGEKIVSSKSASLTACHSSITTSVPATNMSSSSMSVLAAKKSNDSKLLSASVQIQPLEISKDSKIKKIGALFSKSIGADQKRNELPKSQLDLPRNTSSAEISMNLKAERIGLSQRGLGPNSTKNSLKASAGQLPQCSVKVVTLSPSSKNLLSHKTVSKYTDEKVKSQSKGTCEKISTPSVSHSNKSLAQDTSGTPSPSVSLTDGKEKSNPGSSPTTDKASDVSKNRDQLHTTPKDSHGSGDDQPSESPDISTDVSLNSSKEELLKVTDKTKSKISLICSRKPQNFPQNGNVSNGKQNKEAPVSDPSTGATTDGQFYLKDRGENKTQVSPQNPETKSKKRTTKIVFVHSGKPAQVLSSVKCDNPGDLISKVQQPSGILAQPHPVPQLIQTVCSSAPRLSASVSTLDISKLERPKTTAGLGLTGAAGGSPQLVNKSVSYTVVEGSSILTSKPLTTPIKLIRSVAPHKASSVAPVSGGSQQKAVRVMPVVTSNTPGSMNALTTLKADSMCSPMIQVPVEAQKTETSKGETMNQCEPGISSLSTHIQIKGGVVTHKPKVVTTVASARPVPIVSSLNSSHTLSQIPTPKGMISPKLITTADVQSSMLHPSTAALVQPATAQVKMKASAKVISPPTRVISHTGSAAGAVRPKGITPSKICIQPEVRKLNFPGAVTRPVQTVVGLTPSTKIQTVKISSTAAAAPPFTSSNSMSTGENSPQPQFQTHVIRTLMSSKPLASNSAKHQHSVRVPNPTLPVRRSVDYPSSSQNTFNITQTKPVASSVISPSRHACLQPEKRPSITAPAVGSATTLEPESLFIQPPSNPIMITLEDGSTAMLDPESLVQLLSPVDETVPVETLPEPSPTVMVTDPGSVMVNMSEIQPSQGFLQTGEVLWEGFPDMSDTTDDF